MSRAQLDELIAIVSASIDADELMAEPVTDEEYAYARDLAARLRSGAGTGPHVTESDASAAGDDSNSGLDEWDWDLWLLLGSATAEQVRSGPAVQGPGVPGPVTAEDPSTGAVVVVRPGPEVGTWDVRLTRAEPGRYRIRLAWGESPDGVLAVELAAKAGTTARALTLTGSRTSPPDRVRVQRLDG
ncbi:hypothetical protein ACI8AA_01460 [Geodermatophilus sp. SYSU D01180]